MTDSFDGVIVGENLVVGQNSFLTLAQGLMLAKETIGVDAFVNSPVELQIAALVDAYERICSMELRSRILPIAIAYNSRDHLYDEGREMINGCVSEGSQTLDLSNGGLYGTTSTNVGVRREVVSMGELNAVDIAALPLPMRKAFMKAQIIEANVQLNGDPVSELRKAGVMSYTVGEVKQFFRTVKPLDFTVSMKTLGQIGKYIQYNRGIARA